LVMFILLMLHTLLGMLKILLNQFYHSWVLIEPLVHVWNSAGVYGNNTKMIWKIAI
jgi:hypothetical protein